MLRLAFDFIITWRETRTRPNAYLEIITGDRQCIYPNCTERATSNSAYCSYHKPYYLK